MLLPRITYTEEEEIFFVVLCADESGAEIVVQRIREQLKHSEILPNAGLDFAVFFTRVDVPTDSGNPLEQLSKDVTARIEEVVKTKIYDKEGFI